MAELRDLLESGAFVEDNRIGLSDGDVRNTEVTLSAAISLKRIADALDSAGQGEMPGLFGFVTNLAWEAGRSFAAGQRVG